jgi:hypothetical protein
MPSDYVFGIKVTAADLILCPQCPAWRYDETSNRQVTVVNEFPSPGPAGLSEFSIMNVTYYVT